MVVLFAVMFCMAAGSVSAQPCSGDFDCDGTADGSDACPQDYFKRTTAGSCGCHYGGPGTYNIYGANGSADTDGDGVSNCLDYCWWSAAKQTQAQTVAPACPCGVLDDNDNDGHLDCGDDECIYDPNKHEAGVCGCFFQESMDDTDLDGTADCYDYCFQDPDKTDGGFCGCGIPDDDSDMDGLFDCEEWCPFDPNKYEPGECGCGVPEGTC